MAIEYLEEHVCLTDYVTVEEADGLLAWLQKTPAGAVDLSGCSHLHAANLQVLMAARPPIKAWPDDAALAAWLRRSLFIHE